MASHLTVTTTGTSGKQSTKPFGAAAEAAAGDVFAALLGGSTPQDTNPAKSSTSSADATLGMVNMSLGFGSGEAGQDENADAIAAAIDAALPIEGTREPLLSLNTIAESLADLKARLQAGEALDPEALKRLEAALADLAASLDIDLEALPSLDDLTAMIADIQPDDTSFAAHLTAAFGPLAESLFSGSATPANAGVELTALVKSIGDKLAAMLSALNSGEIAPQELAKLELGAQADADLQASLAKLLQQMPTMADGEAVPALAAAELKLTEPVLTGKGKAAPDTGSGDGKAIDAAAPAQGAAGDGGASSGRGDETASQDRKPGDLRPTPLATTVDKQPEPQTAAQIQTGRADMVAAPRVVQAGYQTSQQQLNLPQLAFEMVRQVNDGNTRFQIRLDPPDLGRIDVRLDIDKAGQVNARLIVEKTETLDLMQRDQRALERALQQAGLDGTKTNLEFSLKQSPFSSGQQGEHGGNGRNPKFGDDTPADADEAPPPTVNLYRGSLTASGVNIVA